MAEQFDPTAHNSKDVLAYLKGADALEFARVVQAERDRTDGKDVRSTIANATQTGPNAGAVGPDGYTRVVVDS